ncbi:MAG: lytic transglycosylase domain-containing protein [Treponema sp.]|jgi:soluble lytic murein transglycosylase-like protein|nr:lytic transglycosylase domain-containing protein [Treponema sp.]
MFDYIAALILLIAAEMGIPPYFALAIAVEENSTLNPSAVSSTNADGTIDLGVMQLNSRYWGNINWRDPETNIRAGCQQIKELMSIQELNTYWSVAVAYNCGYAQFVSEHGPPPTSVNYGSRVMGRWLELQGLRYINPVIRRIGKGGYNGVK